MLFSLLKTKLSESTVPLSNGGFKLKCPICDDRKKRGYILNNNGWYYYCHNDSCGNRIPLNEFLKDNCDDGELVYFEFLKQVTSNYENKDDLHIFNNIQKLLNTQECGDLLLPYITKRRLINKDLIAITNIKLLSDIFPNIIFEPQTYIGILMRNLHDEVVGIQIKPTEIPVGFNNFILRSNEIGIYSNVVDETKVINCFEGFADTSFIKNSVSVGGTNHFSKLVNFETKYPLMNIFLDIDMFFSEKLTHSEFNYYKLFKVLSKHKFFIPGNKFVNYFKNKNIRDYNELLCSDDKFSSGEYIYKYIKDHLYLGSIAHIILEQLRNNMSL